MVDQGEPTTVDQILSDVKDTVIDTEAQGDEKPPTDYEMHQILSRGL